MERPEHVSNHLGTTRRNFVSLLPRIERFGTLRGREEKGAQVASRAPFGVTSSTGSAGGTGRVGDSPIWLAVPTGQNSRSFVANDELATLHPPTSTYPPARPRRRWMLLLPWGRAGIRTKILLPLLVLMTLSTLGSTFGFIVSTNTTRDRILDQQLTEEAGRVVAELGQSKEDVHTGAIVLARDPQLIASTRAISTNREAALMAMVDRVVVARNRFRLDQVVILGSGQLSPWVNVTTMNELSQVRIYESPMLSKCEQGPQTHLLHDAKHQPVLVCCTPIWAASNEDDRELETAEILGRVYTMQHVPRTLERIRRELGLKSALRLDHPPSPGGLEQFKAGEQAGYVARSLDGYRVRPVVVDMLDPQQPVTVLLSLSEQEIREIVDSGLHVMLASSGVTLTLLTILGCFLAHSLSSPILKLAEVARSVAMGDFSRRANLNHQDEIGELGRVLDQATTTITELLEQRARRAGELQAILQSMGDGVLAIDRNERIVMVNPTAAALLGQIPAALLNRPLEVLAEVEDPVLSSGLLHLIEQLRRELTDPNRDQTEEHVSFGERIVRLQSAPILGSKDTITGAVVIIQDITEAVEADRAKSAFIATASHEMRTPLTAMRGFVDIFIMSGIDNLTENQRTFLMTIKRQTEQMVQMVNDLLEVARLEQGNVRIEHQWVSVNQVVDEALENLSNLIAQRKVEVHVEICPKLPSIWIDVIHMRRILINLLSNAVKYVYPGGQVRIRAYHIHHPDQLPGDPGDQPWKHASASSVIIEVHDNGVGINKRDQPKIFTRFFRSENPLTVEAGGSGLGLSITRSLVHLHQGQIGFWSEEQKGSCFWVRFPAPALEPWAQQHRGSDRQEGAHAWDSENLLAS